MHVSNSTLGAPFWHRHPKWEANDASSAPVNQRALLGASGSTESQSAGEVVRSVSAASRGAVAADISGPAASKDAVTYDAALIRKQKASLNIATQDGDGITIRFRSREAVAVQSTTTGTAEGESSDFRLHAFASGRVEIAVQGELDADELKAIGELVEKVDALANEFFSGDFEAAFAAAAELGFDSSEIADFSLKLSLKESVRASTQSALPQPAPTSSPPATSGTAPTADTGAASAPTQSPAAAAPPASAPAAAEPAPADAEPPTSETPPASSAPATPAKPQPLQEILGHYVRQIMDSLAQTPSAGRIEFSMSWKLRLVATALESSAQPQAAASPGAKLLGETLQEVAATQRP